MTWLNPRLQGNSCGKVTIKYAVVNDCSYSRGGLIETILCISASYRAVMQYKTPETFPPNFRKTIVI
jgi:hypothetical protein